MASHNWKYDGESILFAKERMCYICKEETLRQYIIKHPKYIDYYICGGCLDYLLKHKDNKNERHERHE